MMDDLDISDVGVYGSPDILTETIDSVAAQGMRFEQYYVNSPVCAPTEASILTGQYPSRFGFKRAVVPKSMRGIPADVTSIARVLKSSGYRTAHIGKWFVGTNKPEFLPPAKGFDHSVRLVTGHYLGYLKYELSFDEGPPVLFNQSVHLTNALTDSAIEFIEGSHVDHPQQPFFLNLWYFAPHRPIEPPIDFDNSKTEYCLAENITGDKCDTQRGNYAALVTHVDQQIKRVLEKLDDLGITDNTLVMITSDNGGGSPWHSIDSVPNRNMRGFKASLFEGGIRVPMIVRWPEVIAKDSVNQSVVASFDALPTFAELAEADVTDIKLDGESFVPVLRKNVLKLRKAPLFWENKISNSYFSNSSGVLNSYAIRDGDWKLVVKPAKVRSRHKKMLFNLAEDRAEQRDLNGDGDDILQQFSVLDYRVTVSKSAAKAGILQPPASQAVINQLQNNYYQWRRNIGSIAFKPTVSATGITRDKNTLMLKGGVAMVARDTRFDFHDGDFSYITRILPKDVSKRAIVSEKPGSWRLFVENQHLILEVFPDNSEINTAMQTDGVALETQIEANQKYHVAFTVFGFKKGGSTIRLYLNGRIVAEFSDGSGPAGIIGIKQVNSVDEPNKPMIYVGNDRSGTSPFTGTIEIPRMSVLCLYPDEVFGDYANIGS